MTAMQRLPALLEPLLESVAANQPIDPGLLEGLARWRLGCGDARGAARWRRWSLDPADATAIRSALQELLLLQNRTDLAARLGEPPGWPAVLQALREGGTEQALRQQQRLIEAEEPLDLPLSQQLAALWQSHGHLEPCLALLLGMARRTPSAPLANAIAHLFEQLEQPAEASRWWDRSLQMEPCQPLVLAQRSRNALTVGEAALAFQLAQALLELDAGHAQGLELRVEALQALGARASLRLALAPLVRQRRERFRAQARSLQAWWHPRRRHQHHWRGSLAWQAGSQAGPAPIALAPPRPVPPERLSGCRNIALIGSRDGLELAGALQQAAPEGVLWDLCSPEPLRTQINLQRLLPAGWQLRPWPRWTPELHAELEVQILAGGPFPPAAGTTFTGAQLHWCGRAGGWQPHPQPQP